MPLDVVACPGARLDLPGLGDGAGAHRVVGVLVDEDERTDIAVVRVRIGHHDGTGAQRHRADVIQREFHGMRILAQRFGIQSAVQLLDRGAHRARRLLQRDPVPRTKRRLREPADRDVELTGGDR